MEFLQSVSIWLLLLFNLGLVIYAIRSPAK